ncbi:MAG TPA: hypothetical protein VH814_21125 [Steroidobacteraceae bacterium]|jgi:photosystem II stability/assembly factor-like uncharacterized protein
MKPKALLLASLVAICVCGHADEVPLPIADGHYTFLVRFAEHLTMTGGQLDVAIRGRHIVITSKPKASVFPTGLVVEGILLWHAPSKQWIIGETEADAAIEDVGGCTGGPVVVDLERKEFWTC